MALLLVSINIRDIQLIMIKNITYKIINFFFLFYKFFFFIESNLIKSQTKYNGRRPPRGNANEPLAYWWGHQPTVNMLILIGANQ